VTDLCLINPPRPYLVNPHAQAPLGLLYVAAAVERAGYTVRIANLAGQKHASLRNVPPTAKVYGITGTHLDLVMVKALASHLKRVDYKCRIVVGGPISMSNEVHCDDIDAVFQGEADGCAELIMTDSDKRTITCGSPPEPDVIGMPARHLWPGPFGGNVFIGQQNYQGGGSTTIMSSRGCPHSCAFCASAALCNRNVRLYEPASVVAEMEECVTRYGVSQFRFSDEFFTANRDHVHSICTEIRNSPTLGYGHDIAWRASVAVKPHSLDMFRHMADAGCREVAFGVETADPDVLYSITRKGTVDDAYAALATAKKAGLKTRALMMTGLPGETAKTFWHNLKFFADAQFDALALAVFTPFPGCEIARNPKKFNCEILPEQTRQSVCLYARDGTINANPRIRIEGMSDADFHEHIERTITAARSTGRLGKG